MPNVTLLHWREEFLYCRASQYRILSQYLRQYLTFHNHFPHQNQFRNLYRNHPRSQSHPKSQNHLPNRRYCHNLLQTLHSLFLSLLPFLLRKILTFLQLLHETL
jgi:hypothetical protein